MNPKDMCDSNCNENQPFSPERVAELLNDIQVKKATEEAAQTALELSKSVYQDASTATHQAKVKLNSYLIRHDMLRR